MALLSTSSHGFRWRAGMLLAALAGLLQLQSVVAQMKCHNSKKLITDYRLKHAFNGSIVDYRHYQNKVIILANT
jgi:hypothetical protein